ncbi:MAG TPA: MgtC/SapB family protein [Candidatus Polarisedimenticolia bacterium]|nr:MgtC/SapB family protein [Candidatus Polarisedimenticolia bacterium]
MAADVVLQIDLVTRLLAAAVLGAAVGVEREIHGHAAGMRTNLLVALGSAAFTVLSIYAFEGIAGAAPVDPSRVAAQLVTGIGFLGAGAILKDGATIRGLTTAAGLWTVAAIGMAAGTGSYIIAFGVTIIAILSLWPLNVIADWLRDRGAPREPTD